MSKRSVVTLADIQRANDKLIERSSSAKLSGIVVSSLCGAWRDAKSGKFIDIKVGYDAEKGNKLWSKVIESHVSKKS